MRLTLRTLLAYLDDTLEPAQAKVIAGKIQDNEAAQELVERIKQVLRKRRLTTPPETGPSKIDPNTVAEYLDQAANAETAAEIEQIFLASDVHLAEVAQCHQMLTLHLSEAKDYPESAKQRMYELVKGPESRKAVKGEINFPSPAIKPGAPKAVEKPERRVATPVAEPVPASRGTKNWLVFGGAMGAVVLLGLALWQFLNLPSPHDNHGEQPVAHLDKDKDKDKGGDKDKSASTPEVPIRPPVEVVDDKKKPPIDNPPIPPLPPVEIKNKDPEVKLPPLSLPELNIGAPPKNVEVVKVPFAAPNNKVVPIGKMAPPGPEPAVLLQQSSEPPLAWHRLGLRNFDIASGRSFVNLPGVSSNFLTPSNLGVKLVGNLNQINPYLGDFETRVDFHLPETFDLDLTLHRGRIILASFSDEKPLTVRVRFENPTFPGQNDRWDVTLHEKGTEVMIDRMCQMPVGEPFYRNPMNPERKGPVALMKCLARKGTATVQINDLKRTLNATFGRTADIDWNSLKGSVEGPTPHDNLPEWAKDVPGLPQGFDEKQRTRAVFVRDYLLKNLRESEVDVALTNAIKSPDQDIRKLAIRYSEAIDDIPAVLDSLKSDQKPMRLAAIFALQDWISLSRDNDYKLFEILQKSNKANESEIIMHLLHYFSEAQIQRPDTYELLINYLVHPNLAVRELGAWHLYALARSVKIDYDATNPQVCQRAHAAWMNLLMTKQLPPPKK